MAECVHVIAVDVRHRAGSPELQIAGEEGHAHGITGLQWSFIRHVAGMKSGPAAAAWNESLILERAAEEIADLGVEPRHDQRRGDRPQQRADLSGRESRNRADAC